jgi:hypothetical protein
LRTDLIKYKIILNFDPSHEIGTSEQMNKLPLSNQMKKRILNHLTQGFVNRDVRINMQRNIQPTSQRQIQIAVNNRPGAVDYVTYTTIHRDQLIDNETVYNQYKKIHETILMRNTNERESIRI